MDGAIITHQPPQRPFLRLRLQLKARRQPQGPPRLPLPRQRQQPRRPVVWARLLATRPRFLMMLSVARHLTQTTGILTSQVALLTDGLGIPTVLEVAATTQVATMPNITNRAKYLLIMDCH